MNEVRWKNYRITQQMSVRTYYHPSSTDHHSVSNPDNLSTTACYLLSLILQAQLLKMVKLVKQFLFFLVLVSATAAPTDSRYRNLNLIYIAKEMG